MRLDSLRGADAGTLLVRALRAQAMAAGVVIAVRSIATRPWASATFVGTCHRIAIEAEPGDTFDRWIATMPESEWIVRGHLVADLIVDRIIRDAGIASVSISILTIEDN
ncbi:hypothetical protein [Sphingomonas bacterium]|uniref:hypothetical protein n=1 Tax=Sphingomonas bacterium TaxID=1895847 RepID=UPI001575E297|nr:hypothetical protein [Sphingomonas bacterium]